MPNYDCLCYRCEEVTELNFSIQEENIPKDLNVCPECGRHGTLDKIITTVPGVNYIESQSEGESAKSLSYWNNAERERLKALKKQQKIARDYEHDTGKKYKQNPS